MNQLIEYINNQLITHPGVRVFKIDFEGKSYWIKQPEKLKGWLKVLKYSPKKSYEIELKRLKFLKSKQINVPAVIYEGQDFFVLEDTGDNISSLVVSSDLDLNQKKNLLLKVTKQLADMHLKGMYHGRPALRDITIKNDEIFFIDFENRKVTNNIKKQQVIDLFIFLHELAKLNLVNNIDMIESCANLYSNLNPPIFLSLKQKINQFMPIYKFSLLFKKFAKKDLLAAYKVFNFFVNNFKQ